MPSTSLNTVLAAEHRPRRVLDLSIHQPYLLPMSHPGTGSRLPGLTDTSVRSGTVKRCQTVSTAEARLSASSL
jgi:hypothetical protein